MESLVSNELLLYFYLAISSGLMQFDDYVEILNDLFLADAGRNDILLTLEFCTGDLKETLATLETALYNKVGQINYQKVGKMLFDELGRQYSDNIDVLKELTHKLYIIWTLLPDEISNKEPFIQLNSIDDFWSWDGKDEVIEQINWLINYFNT